MRRIQDSTVFFLAYMAWFNMETFLKPNPPCHKRRLRVFKLSKWIFSFFLLSSLSPHQKLQIIKSIFLQMILRLRYFNTRRNIGSACSWSRGLIRVSLSTCVRNLLFHPLRLLEILSRMYWKDCFLHGQITNLVSFLDIFHGQEARLTHKIEARFLCSLSCIFELKNTLDLQKLTTCPYILQSQARVFFIPSKLRISPFRFKEEQRGHQQIIRSL